MHSPTDDETGAAATPRTEHHDETPPRQIGRSRDDRMLAGVCGGIAKHFGIDPVIVRVTTIALVFAAGIGVAPYIAAWILMPIDGDPVGTIAPTAQPAHS